MVGGHLVARLGFAGVLRIDRVFAYDVPLRRALTCGFFV
jgi:hypothetical protein